MTTDGMTTGDEVIACQLSERAFAERSDLLAAGLFPAVEAVEELTDGYRLRLPSDATWTERVLAFVAAERRCCPFFTFEVIFTPHDGPLWLGLRGSAAIKAFVRDNFPLAPNGPAVTPNGAPDT